MTNLSVFQFESNLVRVVFVKDKPWFVAKDVLEVLQSSTTVTALKTMVQEDLGEEFVSNQPLSTPGGTQKLLCLSEPALTLFVSRSRTELGKRLNRWIHAEILPTIRETGSYSVKDQKWQNARLKGKDVRRSFTDAVKDYIDRHPELSESAKKFMYSNATDAMYLKTHGARARKLIQLIGCPKDKLRDSVTSKELMALSSVEFVAVRLVDAQDMNPIEAIKQAVERALVDGLFSEQYLAGADED